MKGDNSISLRTQRELKIFHHNFLSLAVDIEVNLEDIGSIDELTYIIVLNYDVCCDDTALVIDLNEFLTRFESAVEGSSTMAPPLMTAGILPSLRRAFTDFLPSSRRGSAFKSNVFIFF